MAGIPPGAGLRNSGDVAAGARFPGEAGCLPPACGHGGFACLLAAEASYGGRNDRYAVDFQPSLILLLSLAGGFCVGGDAPARSSIRLQRAGYILLGCRRGDGKRSRRHPDGTTGSKRAAAALVPFPVRMRQLPPVRLLTRLGLLHYGPVLLPQGDLRPHGSDRRGAADRDRDSHLHRRALCHPATARGGPGSPLIHAGYGAIISAPYRASRLGREYDVEADLGSLYPQQTIRSLFQGLERRRYRAAQDPRRGAAVRR